MGHPLEQQVALVGKRARRATVLFGASRVITLALGMLLMAAGIDWALRLEDRGLRIMLSLLVLAGFGFVVWRYLLLPLTRRIRDLDVALRIERRFPQLRERLSSAMEFLGEPEEDPQAGSAMLRRAVIVQAEGEIQKLDLTSVLDLSGPRRAAAAAVAACLLVTTLAVLVPEHFWTGLVRLAAPLGVREWPKVNHLAFKQTPTRVAVGQPFEVELIDRNDNLPEEARIHYRYEVDGGWSEEVEAMQPFDGLLVARKENVNRSFEYRATGGDDTSMPWTRLEVVEPPLVATLEITLQAPAYTGLPITKADKQIRALRGTRVGIVGTSTKPLTGAKLMLDSGLAVTAKISDDGYRFTIDPSQLRIDRSGSYWFVLDDTEGLSGGAESRWEVRAIPDTAPTVAIEDPATNLYVTKQAVIPLKILVKDNLAIRSVTLCYTRSDKSEQGDIFLPLYQGPKQAPAAKSDLNLATDLGETRVVTHTWDLAELDLSPGTQLSVAAHATDYLPQVSHSPSRRISIISSDELEDRLAQRESLILAELAQSLELQRNSRAQTTELEIQIREVGHLITSDLDRLQSAELNQRQVTRRLASKTEGIPGHISRLLDDLKNNRVDNPDLARRLEGFLSEINRLDKDWLPVVRRELTTALKSAQGEPLVAGGETDPVTKTSLAAAGKGQDHVVESLEKLLGDLSEWADYRRFAREVRQVKADLEETRQETTELGKQTLTKDLKDLNSQQQADLEKIANRHMELGRRFDRVLQNMDEMSKELQEKEPLSAATLEDAVSQARSDMISGDFREASRRLQQNQVGQVVQDQAKIAEKLDELLDTLSNRREHELSRLVEKLREAEQQLSGLRAKQKRLQEALEAAEQNSNEQQRKETLQKLAKEQRPLQEEIDRMARKLRRLQAEEASRSTEQAAKDLQQSTDAAQQQKAEQANKGAESARKSLDEAQQKLAEQRQKAEADLAQEQMARLEDVIQSLMEQEQRVLEDTERLNRAWTDSDPQMRPIRDLARLQEFVRDQTAGASQKLGAAKVFQFALAKVQEEMTAAARRLLARDIGTETQQLERSATQRLSQLLSVLTQKDEPLPLDEADEENSSGGDSGGGDGNQGQVSADLNQLKLLRLMQQDLNEQTREVERQLDSEAKLSPEQAKRYAGLQRQQGELADLLFDLLLSGKNQEAVTDTAEESAQEEDELPLDEIPLDEAAPPEDKAPAEDKTPAEDVPLDEDLPELDLE